MNKQSITQDKLIPAVIYARFSSSSQREESIDDQVRVCTEYAKSHGYKILKVYADEAKTGRTDKRIQFQQLLADSSKKIFTTVLVYKIDRFARNRYDSISNEHTLKLNGVKVVSVMEYIPDGAAGVMTKGMLESIAEWYSANLSENVKRGNYGCAIQYKTLGIRVFGYTKDETDHYVLDPANAVIAKKIFERYANGESATQIINDLNRSGVKSAYGKKWCHASLGRMLTNKKYIGTYHYKDIEVPDAMPRIISDDLFYKVQNMRKYHAKSPAASRDVCYYLTGKLFCGNCGTSMIGEYGTSSHTKSKYYYYVCVKSKKRNGCKMKRIQKEKIESFVINYLFDLIYDDDFCNEVADTIVKMQQETSETNF